MLVDYKCHYCGHIQEELVKYSQLNDFKFKCEKCGGDAGERQLSMPAVLQPNGKEGNLFKGGLITSMDTLNGRPKKSKKKISNQYRNTTPE